MDDYVPTSKWGQFGWACFALFVLLAGAGLVFLVSYSLVLN